MIVAFVYAILLCHAPVRADEAPPVVVWSNGYYEKLRTVLPKNTKFMDQAVDDEEARREGYLPAHERDALFRRLNLHGALEKFDDLDKDMLVMDARDSTPAELKRRYPSLTLEQSRRLTKELGKRS